MIFAQDDSTAEKAIHTSLQQMKDARNKNDMNAYCNQLTEDSTWIKVFGKFWRNKKEAIKVHDAFAETLFKYFTVSFESAQTQFQSCLLSSLLMLIGLPKRTTIG